MTNETLDSLSRKGFKFPKIKISTKVWKVQIKVPVEINWKIRDVVAKKVNWTFKLVLN